jgi:hypothetical protein
LFSNGVHQCPIVTFQVITLLAIIFLVIAFLVIQKKTDRSSSSGYQLDDYVFPSSHLTGGHHQSHVPETTTAEPCYLRRLTFQQVAEKSFKSAEMFASSYIGTTLREKWTDQRRKSTYVLRDHYASSTFTTLPA